MQRDTIKFWARMAFWLSAIGAYVFAIMPNNPEVFRSDKANHALAFVAMAVLARLGYSKATAVLIGIALIAFGAFIELSQALPIIHRDASWGDLLADTIATVAGLVIGTLLLMLIRRAPLPQRR